jgi:hypothetical protein
MQHRPGVGDELDRRGREPVAPASLSQQRLRYANWASACTPPREPGPTTRKVARPSSSTSLATERLLPGPDGLVRIALKRPFSDGTGAIDLDPLSLLCRLAATVPPPRFHTIRYAGALDGAFLVSANGTRIPLAQAVSLLGLEQPEAFVETPSAPAPARAGNSNAVPGDGFYSSRKGAPHLPGKSRRWMLDHAREIPGAKKIGRDWIVPHVAYVQWLADQDAARARAEAVPSPSQEADARTIAERTLANAGLRPTREC